MNRTSRRLAPLATALAIMFSAQVAAQAAANDTDLDVAVPAQALAGSLTELARQTQTTLVAAPGLLDGKAAPAVTGRLSARQAYARVLEGSGLVASLDGNAVVVRQAAADTVGGGATLPPVTVKARRDGDLPEAYAGGQVARGARVGALGNGDFMDTPVSVVAFTSEFRDNTQALSVSDMLKYGVSVQSPMSGAVATTDVIYVRGFDVGSYDGTFDGMPGLLGRMPPMEAVERVELLLGANTFANGQPGAVGGSINLVPKRAGAAPLARVGVNYRTESIVGTSFDVGQRFGVDNAIGLRLNGAYADGSTELSDGDRRAVSRALAFDYRGDGKRFTFDYFGNTRRLPAEPWFDIAAGGSLPDAKRANRDFRQPWTYYKDVIDTAVARGEWDLTDQWTVSAAFGRMWTRVERLTHVSEVIDDAGNTVDAYGGTFGHSKQRREGYAGELQVRGRFKTGPVTHNARIGVGEFGDKSGYAGIYQAGVPDGFPSNIYNPVHYPRPALAEPDMPSGFDSRTRNRSLFVSDELSFLDDRWRVTLGARQVQFKGEALDGSGQWGGDPVKKTWSPGFGVLFKAQPWLTVYGNRLEGLTAGYRVDNVAALNDGQILPALAAKQTEIGAKADLGEQAVTLAVFEIDRPSYLFNTVTQIEGADGRQVNRGVELSLFGQVARGLNIYSSMTFIDPRLKKTFNGELDGKVPGSAARFLANVHADWEIPGVAGLAVLGGVSHTGRVYVGDANLHSVNAWTRLDGGVRYATNLLGRPAALRLNVDNLLDKKYWVSERSTVYLAPKRTVSVSMTVDL